MKQKKNQSIRTKNVSDFSNMDFVLMSILLLGIGVLYYQIFTGLFDDWSNNDNYSHGFFIPVISVYMVYSLRGKLRALAIQPSSWGLLILIIGMVQLLVAKTGSEFFLQRTSLIPILLGMILFCLGSAYTKKLLLPICYLLFMIPLPAIIWNKIAFPMQLFATGLTESVIRLIGISVFREGNILHLAETSLEVIDACSGLRSLITMFSLSAAFAWFSDFSLSRKWVLFLMAAPIAIFSNIIRLTSTAVLASRYGSEVAQGFLHEFSGFLTFFIGLVMLITISAMLNKIRKRP
jgi:exosortase